MLSFCLHSLLREYGWQFFRHVAAPHPVRTVKAFLRSSRYDFTSDAIATSNEEPGPTLGGRRSVVGVGFCLKPLSPPCLSGRSNHDCLYLERLMHTGSSNTPDCCRQCAIREIGIMALKAEAAFYIMTSAKDILLDVFAPSLKEGRFVSGLFLLCRYSLRPFTVGLLASDIRGWLFPFERGDCADYKTWLRADRGDKDEQTAFGEQTRKSIGELLDGAAKTPDSHKRFKRQGNILCPE
ncbi:MAG: hypothetical protein JW955_04825 [Sedimentisphaerales bacterium]|nr:hypothetical protein [Sedimentisphaerales bacterium]